MHVPAASAAVGRIPPEQQTARLLTERRAKGKLVTVIAGLDSADNDLSELATRLKNACGAGGTVKDGQIELQGDHLQRRSERSNRSATIPRPPPGDTQTQMGDMPIRRKSVCPPFSDSKRGSVRLLLIGLRGLPLPPAAG